MSTCLVIIQCWLTSFLFDWTLKQLCVHLKPCVLHIYDAIYGRVRLPLGLNNPPASDRTNPYLTGFDHPNKPVYLFRPTRMQSGLSDRAVWVGRRVFVQPYLASQLKNSTCMKGCKGSTKSHPQKLDYEKITPSNIPIQCPCDGTMLLLLDPSFVLCFLALSLILCWCISL